MVTPQAARPRPEGTARSIGRKGALTLPIRGATAVFAVGCSDIILHRQQTGDGSGRRGWRSRGGGAAPNPAPYVSTCAAWNFFDFTLFQCWAARLTTPVYILGDALEKYGSAFTAKGMEMLGESTWRPRGMNLGLLGEKAYLIGERTELSKIAPLYLRLPEAESKWSEKHGFAENE